MILVSLHGPYTVDLILIKYLRIGRVKTPVPAKGHYLQITQTATTLALLQKLVISDNINTKIIFNADTTVITIHFLSMIINCSPHILI